MKACKEISVYSPDDELLGLVESHINRLMTFMENGQQHLKEKVEAAHLKTYIALGTNLLLAGAPFVVRILLQKVARKAIADLQGVPFDKSRHPQIIAAITEAFRANGVFSLSSHYSTHVEREKMATDLLNAICAWKQEDLLRHFIAARYADFNPNSVEPTIEKYKTW